jgi:hypothetical protein
LTTLLAQNTFRRVNDRDRGDRPKKSWRELDTQRDRPRPATGERPRSSPQQEAAASKQYRAQLDALFAKGEVGKLAEKLGVTPRTPVDPPKAEPVPAAPPPPEKPKEDPRAVLRKKILEAVGREEISRAVDRYLKQHPWPQDFEVLEQALEHTKSERVGEALAALETLLVKDKPRRSRSLVGKLRFIEETGADEELKQVAARVRTKLG